MKCLIIGGSGMLGHKLVQVLSKSFETWTTVRGNFKLYEKFSIFDKKRTLVNIDIENTDSLENIIKEIKPQVIINAVGLVKQLPGSKDMIRILTINSIFPHRLLEIAKKFNARLINISTDCVFSGEKGSYKETDFPDASDLYGKSKNLGEVIGDNCLTLRTSIIGRELKTKHSLVEWFFSNKEKKVKGFTNAVFSGFPTIILSKIIVDLIENHKDISGLYHVSSEPINKFELLKLLKQNYRIEIDIEPSEDLKINRSLDSTRFRQETGFKPLTWNNMIKQMAADPTKYDL